ncbi:MAG TPA: UDP-glucose/GDP-mannose dehydrogenase family protein [Rickettsiales bacterium]|nr:UDP-glucose/GDP-mannose dehydrogenase family protein [Rickettsiales bacterium]
MKICIIGTGYIGLTEGLCFADLGHEVNCFDIIKDKIEKLQKGIPTLYEEGLEEMLKRNLKKKTINFTTDLKEALKDREVVFICVNTPPNPKDDSADLTALIQATKDIAKNMEKKFVLVVRSTVPVGTNKMVKKLTQDTNPNLQFTTASNPEFSKQGTAIHDFLNPDRIIVGVNDDKTKTVMEKVYKPLSDKGAPILFTSIETAELMKYASNTFLAMKIAFINEIADICEKTGANVDEIAKAMGMDKRISPYFLQAGPGIGGSCFPKDSIALYNVGKKLGLDMDLVLASSESNKKRKKRMAQKILEASNGKLKNKKIALLGLTFKANTDDTRFSPALDIIKQLYKQKVYVNAYDPKGIEKCKSMLEKKFLKTTNFFDNSYEAIKDSELLVIDTEWEEFKKLDYKKIYKLLNQKVIVDLRNILDKNEIEKIGFKYICIGK